MFDNSFLLCYDFVMDYSVALSIMFEILSHKRSASQLAEEFEISNRTVYRYIDSLCGAGIPIVSKQGRYGGFEMSNYFKIHDFFLTRGEKKYLLNLLSNQNDVEGKTLAHKIKALGTF